MIIKAIFLLGVLFSICLSASAADWGGRQSGKPAAPPGAVEKAITNPDVRVTFSEGEFAGTPPADGFSTDTIDGVRLRAPLSFLDSSNSSNLGDGGPGTQLFIDPPGIEGDAAVNLIIDFGADVVAVSFGFSLLCDPPVSPGTTVDLITSQGTIIDTIVRDGLDTGFEFPENEFEIRDVRLRRLSLTFNDADCGAFFVDNLAYRYFVHGIPTLAPWAILLLITLLGSLGAFAYRYRRAS